MPPADSQSNATKPSTALANAPSSAPSAPSAYGGAGWVARAANHAAEIGSVWAGHRVDSEYGRLSAVLLHRPGAELTAAGADPDALLMLAAPDPETAGAEHDRLADAYRAAGVVVHYVDPPGVALANAMFCADLFLMTPEGAILARPAGAVRAGEERAVAARLAALGIPILISLRGHATFEGADAMWLDDGTLLIGRGIRTNQEAVDQIGGLVTTMGVELVTVDMPAGAMHLMGILRILAPDLAIGWPGRLPEAATAALAARGYELIWGPDPDEVATGFALNMVTLARHRVLMPAGNPATQGLLERHGVEVATVQVRELAKAAGAVGCLTGVLAREPG